MFSAKLQMLREGDLQGRPQEEGTTSLNSPGVCSQVPRRLFFRTRSCIGAMLSGPNQGSGLQVLLSVTAEDLEMSPSDVMSDGVPVLHHKQGFILWPQTI